VTAARIEFGDELLDELADRVAARLAEQVEQRPEPWLTVDQAAEYLACPVSRIYDLKARGEVEFGKDGSRLLFRREWLDAAVGGCHPIATPSANGPSKRPAGGRADEGSGSRRG
jgi:excisionase family DNA binding protein